MKTSDLGIMRKPLENLNGLSGIYCIIHRNSLMVYIGSSVDMRRRFVRHLWDAEKGSTSCFHRALRQFGQDAFDFEIIEKVPREWLVEREEFWISFFRAASADGGFNTLKSSGATYTGECSEITRQRISSARRGIKHSKATRDKIRMAALSRGRSLEHTENLRKAHLGRKLSPEHLEKLRRVNRGRNQSPEAIKKMVDGRRAAAEKRQLAGLPKVSVSPEGIAARALGRKAAEEHRKLLGLPARKQSPEHVANRVAARRNTLQLRQDTKTKQV